MTCCKRLEEAIRDDCIEQDTFDGSWNVEGCCKHCWTILDIKYCPFCGQALPVGKPTSTENVQ